MTNSGADVTDLYLEKVTGEGYLYDGKVMPFTTRKETIKVAGGDAKTIVVRQTNNGPLLSDRDDELVQVGKKATVDAGAPDRGDGYAIALRWTALDPGNTMDAVFEMDKASDWTEFRDGGRAFEVPSQNLIYADDRGQHRLPGCPARSRRAPRATTARSRRPAGTPSTAGPATSSSPSLPYEYNPSAATSSPPTRRSSTRTSTRTCSPRTGATAPAASGSPT